MSNINPTNKNQRLPSAQQPNMQNNPYGKKDTRNLNEHQQKDKQSPSNNQHQQQWNKDFNKKGDFHKKDKDQR